MYCQRARYYDPTTGRFTQQDPAEDGYNWYVYGSNNPILYIDPTGLSEYEDDSLNMNWWDKYWMLYYTEKYNEVKDDTLLTDTQKYYRMNIYRRYAVKIRRKYNASYVDNYDYTYDGAFDESSFKFSDMLMGLTQKERDESINSTIAMGLKPDIKQINQVAAKMGITGAARREFGDYIESVKKASGKFNNTNFSWQELVELAKEFLGQ